MHSYISRDIPMESTYAIANSIAGVSGEIQADAEKIKTIPGRNIQSDGTEEFDTVLRRRKDRDTVCMAGFYDLTDGGARFVIITTQANASMIKVHDRMPLILEKRQIKDWLSDDLAVEDLLRQTPVLLDREKGYPSQIKAPALYIYYILVVFAEKREGIIPLGTDIQFFVNPPLLSHLQYIQKSQSPHSADVLRGRHR